MIVASTLALVGDDIYVFSASSDSDFYIINRFDGSITADTLGSNIDVYSALYDGSSLWLGSNDTIYEYNFSTLTARVTSTSTYFRDLVYGNSYIWAVDVDNERVVQYDPNASSISAIDVGAEPYGGVYDGVYLWVSNFADDTLTRINTNNSSTTTLDVGTLGTGPLGITFDGSHIWMGFSNSDGIGALNIAEEAAGASNQLSGTSLRHLTFDGTYVWATESSGGRIYKIATGTGFDNGVSMVTRGQLMYNTSGSLICLYVAGTTVTASSTLTNCQ